MLKIRNNWSFPVVQVSKLKVTCLAHPPEKYVGLLYKIFIKLTCNIGTLFLCGCQLKLYLQFFFIKKPTRLKRPIPLTEYFYARKYFELPESMHYEGVKKMPQIAVLQGDVRFYLKGDVLFECTSRESTSLEWSGSLMEPWVEENSPRWDLRRGDSSCSLINTRPPPGAKNQH